MHPVLGLYRSLLSLSLVLRIHQLGLHRRVRIDLPDGERDFPVVVCSELPNNPAGSIANSAEALAAGVIRANQLPTSLMWPER